MHLRKNCELAAHLFPGKNHLYIIRLERSAVVNQYRIHCTAAQVSPRRPSTLSRVLIDRSEISARLLELLLSALFSLQFDGCPAPLDGDSQILRNEVWE